MFTIPRSNVIEKSGQYTVEVLGRTGILYKEGDQAIRIDSEVLAGPNGLVIYTNSMTSLFEPNKRLLLSDSERDRIVSNIKAAFRFRGFEIEVN